MWWENSWTTALLKAAPAGVQSSQNFATSRCSFSIRNSIDGTGGPAIHGRSRNSLPLHIVISPGQGRDFLKTTDAGPSTICFIDHSISGVGSGMPQSVLTTKAQRHKE